MTTSEKTSLRDAFLRMVSQGLSNSEEGGESRGILDLKNVRELVGTLASWAGQSKDEVIQMMCKEIGMAVASTLKEPIAQALEGRKLQFTMQLLPRDSKSKTAKQKTKTTDTSRRRSS